MIKENQIIMFNEKDLQYKETLLNSNKFSSWLEKISKEFIVTNVIVYKINMFGPNVGFVYAEAQLTDKNGNRVPGISFIRGNSVSILLIAKEKRSGAKHAILTYQPRVPAGEYVYEAPAGMIDESSYSIKAIEELQEEIGRDIDFNLDNLIYLDKAYTSPGGTDEEITMYAYEVSMSKKEIMNLNGRETGLENEQITLKVIPLNEVLSYSKSLTTKAAYYAYAFKEISTIIEDFKEKQ